MGEAGGGKAGPVGEKATCEQPHPTSAPSPPQSGQVTAPLLGGCPLLAPASLLPLAVLASGSPGPYPHQLPGALLTPVPFCLQVLLRVGALLDR